MSAKRHPKQPKVHGGGGGPAGSGHRRGGIGRSIRPGGRLPGGGGGPAGPKPKRKPKRSHKRSAAGLLVHGEWVTGYNDEAPTCMATAIANSLLTVTGLRVTDDDVLLLFRQSGAGQGVSMADALSTLATHGIGGAKAAGYRTIPQTEQFCTGDIVGVAGTHAACFTEYGLISWGDVIPDDWEPDGEAWRIDWAA